MVSAYHFQSRFLMQKLQFSVLLADLKYLYGKPADS